MGSSSTNLLIYATSTSKPFIPLFYQIKKTDGSVASIFYLNETNIVGITPASFYKYKFKLMSAKSPEEVYLAISKSYDKYYGLIKINDLSIDSSFRYF